MTMTYFSGIRMENNENLSQMTPIVVLDDLRLAMFVRTNTLIGF